MIRKFTQIMILIVAVAGLTVVASSTDVETTDIAQSATSTVKPEAGISQDKGKNVFFEPDESWDTDEKITLQPDASMTEKTGAIIKVSGLDAVYVDQGSIAGVTVGTLMQAYRMEPIRNMDGEVLDEERLEVGMLRVHEVRARLSIGRVVVSTEDFERGLLVRFFVAKGKKIDQQASGLCPEDMLYDGGGPFVFLPGSLFYSVAASDKRTSETDAFCIDAKPAKDLLTWESAREACRRQGRMLCTKEEKQKVCSVWDKPPHCSLERENAGDCPESDTVEGYSRQQEWTADVIEKDDQPYWDANSCSCPGKSPVCVHCLYEGCRGAKKTYRCCRKPYATDDE